MESVIIILACLTVIVVCVCLATIVVALSRRDGPPQTNSPGQDMTPPSPPLPPPVIVVQLPALDDGKRPVDVKVVRSVPGPPRLLADEQEPAV